MIDAAFRPDRLPAQPVRRAARRQALYDRGLPVVADIVPNETGGTTMTRTDLPPADPGQRGAGPETRGVHAPGRACRRHAAECGRARSVTFFALQSQARVPAMMNFTTGADGMLSCCVAAGIGTILTSRRAVQKRQTGPVGGGASARRSAVVYLEDVRASIGLLDKSARDAGRPARRSGCRAPAWTGVSPRWCCSPRVPRAHRRAWCTAIARCWPIAPKSGQRSWTSTRSDRVFNALPMFHAFGMIAARCCR